MNAKEYYKQWKGDWNQTTPNLMIEFAQSFSDQENKELRDELYRYEKKERDLNDRIEYLEGREEELQSQVEELQKEKEGLDKEIARLVKTNSDYAKKHIKLQKEKEELEGRLEELGDNDFLMQRSIYKDRVTTKETSFEKKTGF